MRVLASILYNLRNLAAFSGRETRAQFWPYAALVLALSIAGFTVVMLPELMDTMKRMQRFAAEHPELATVRSGPGHYSIRIKGHHPELMPKIDDVKFGIVFSIAAFFLAAAVVRRLHDRGKSGVWACMPIPFFAYALVMMPRAFAEPEPNWEFFANFINIVLYNASLVFLVVLLCGDSEQGDNRYGPAPNL